MQTHQIRYALALADLRHFSRAAEACKVSQPALTRAIQRLEEQLGGQLFERHRGRIGLTALGREVLPALQCCYEAIERAKTAAEHLRFAKRSRLRLGVTCLVAPHTLTPAFLRLLGRLPDVEIVATEDTCHALMQQVQVDQLDAAVIASPEQPDGLLIRPLCSERLEVVFAEGHPFGALSQVPFSALLAEKLLVRAHCDLGPWLDVQVGQNWRDLAIRLRTDREDWLQSMVASGLGVTVFLEGTPLIAGLGRRPLTEPDLVRHLALVMPRGRRYGEAADALLRILSNHNK